jgi:hypothetical protein
MVRRWFTSEHLTIETNLLNCLLGIEVMPKYDIDYHTVGSALRIGLGFVEFIIE